jgi:hypothetical protein
MLSNSRESGIICVVDDDEGVRKSFRRYLEVKGLSVRDYCSGEVFLAEMHAPSIGCLVLDFHLPGSTGLEILILTISGLDVPRDHDDWSPKLIAGGASSSIRRAGCLEKADRTARIVFDD